MLINEGVMERVDPRILRTRALLNQAFQEVLMEKGFQAASIQDITEKAGVNRSTFYLHFPDKYALLDYNIHEMFHEALQKRSLNLCHFTPENLHALILTVAEFVAFSGEQCKHKDEQFESLVETQVKKQVQSLLTKWGETTHFGKNSKSAAVAASWAIYGLSQEWSNEKKRSSAEVFVEGSMPLILAILGV
jgi:AcrR family transcriptional regulator